MIRIKYLVPDAIPENNQFLIQEAEVLVKKIAPSNRRVRDLLVELILACGIHPDMRGIEHALLYFVRYAPYLDAKSCVQERERALQLLREYLPYVLQDPNKTKNRLLRLHLTCGESDMYPYLASAVHIGIIGKYEQVPEVEKAVEVARQFCSPISVVLPHLKPGDFTDLTKPKKFRTELERVISRLPKKSMNGRPGVFYPQKTVSNYAGRITAAVFDQERGKKFLVRDGVSRKVRQPIKDEEYFRPDELDRKHPLRQSFVDKCHQTFVEELKELDEARAEEIDKKSDNEKHRYVMWLDQTLSHADKLSLHTIGLLLHNLRQSMFIEDELNRLGVELIFSHLLFLRRPPEFTIGLHPGGIDQVIDGPKLCLEEGVIWKLPETYFGRAETLIK